MLSFKNQLAILRPLPLWSPQEISSGSRNPSDMQPDVQKDPIMTIRARLIIEVGSLHVILAWPRPPLIDNESFEEADEDVDDENTDQDDGAMN
jgi:hypothetical protein